MKQLRSFFPIRNCIGSVRNSKELGAIKSFVDRPEGASQSHVKLKRELFIHVEDTA